MKWFYNMKIASKLISASLLLALVSGIVGYVGISQLNKLSAADKEMYDSNVIPISMVAELSKRFQMLRVIIRDELISDTREQREKYVLTGREQIKQIFATLKQYESAISAKEKRRFSTS
jgi:methyl-accepting chemotaxis protein